MTKKHFIALADAIKQHNKFSLSDRPKFEQWHLNTLVNFCLNMNSQFKVDRWLSYIDGTCGSNGGALPKPKKPLTNAQRLLRRVRAND